MLAAAQAEANRIGVLRNSIRQGAGNLVGCIGEQAFLHLFPMAVSDNTYQHDVRIGDMTFEVKTKDRTVAPELDYDASIANTNATQNAEYYAFFSVYRNKNTNQYMRAFFCGFMKTEEYFSKARFMTAGTIDPRNNFRVRTDCWNVPYSELSR